MKVTVDDKEYRGLAAVLIAIPSCVAVGLVLMVVGAALSSPLWLLVYFAQVIQ